MAGAVTGLSTPQLAPRTPSDSLTLGTSPGPCRLPDLIPTVGTRVSLPPTCREVRGRSVWLSPLSPGPPALPSFRGGPSRPQILPSADPLCCDPPSPSPSSRVPHLCSAAPFKPVPQRATGPFQRGDPTRWGDKDSVPAPRDVTPGEPTRGGEDLRASETPCCPGPQRPQLPLSQPQGSG